MKKKILRLMLVCVMLMNCFNLVAMAAREDSVGAEANDSVSEYNEVDVKSDEVFVGTPDMVDAVAEISQKYGIAKNNEVDFSNYESVEATVLEIADGLYQVMDETGEIIALYETETSTGMQPRLGWTINWTVKPNVQTAADSQFSSYNGLKFSYELEFSKTGSSKIGYANHDKQTVTWVETSDSGFDGSFTFLKDVGVVSLAIKNASSSTITYSGVYYVS